MATLTVLRRPHAEEPRNRLKCVRPRGGGEQPGGLHALDAAQAAEHVVRCAARPLPSVGKPGC